MAIRRPGDSQQKVGYSNGGAAWFAADKASVGRALRVWCDKIESRDWGRRFDLLSCYRYMTNTPGGWIGFNYSAVGRPVTAAFQSYRRATWTAPVKNIIAICWDALLNRVYKSRPGLVVATTDGTQASQRLARERTRYLDAMMADGFWPLVEECAQDAATWGPGFMLIEPDAAAKKIVRLVVKADEVIVDQAEAAANNVQTLAIRLFVNRYKMADDFEHDPAAVAAIMAAPKAELGFYWNNDLDTTDVIVMRLGFHLGDEDCGRRTLTVGDYVLSDEIKEIERFPLCKLTHKKLGFWGKGSVQDSIGLQREHFRMSGAIWENMRRAAWPRVGIPKGSGINRGEISGSSGQFYEFNPGLDAEFKVQQATNPEQFIYVDKLERDIMDVWGLSEQAAGQDTIGNDASGRARLAQDQIDDRRHVALLQHLEDFVTDCGYAMVKAAETVRPKLVADSRVAQSLTYPGFKNVVMRAFPVSQIPQSIPGKQAWIDRAFSEGRISREMKTRLEGMPDIDSEAEMITAPLDNVDVALDAIVSKEEYTPPSGIGDLPLAFDRTQRRILLEQKRQRQSGDNKEPSDRVIGLLFRYLSAINELRDEAAAATAPPAPALPAALPGVPTGAPPVAGLPTPDRPMPVAA
ncbi:MAG TPA: hypothetical protein VLZ78_07845 [Terrimesophilobacter sp.]|nr:hypothetical protein [Terrimesophilobacter sp.]